MRLNLSGNIEILFVLMKLDAEESSAWRASDGEMMEMRMNGGRNVSCSQILTFSQTLIGSIIKVNEEKQITKRQIFPTNDQSCFCSLCYSEKLQPDGNETETWALTFGLDRLIPEWWRMRTRRWWAGLISGRRWACRGDGSAHLCRPAASAQVHAGCLPLMMCAADKHRLQCWWGANTEVKENVTST